MIPLPPNWSRSSFFTPDCFVYMYIHYACAKTGTEGGYNTEGWRGKLSILQENVTEMMPVIQQLFFSLSFSLFFSLPFIYAQYSSFLHC